MKYLFLCCIFLSSLHSLAQDKEDDPRVHIYNYTGMFTPITERAIEVTRKVHESLAADSMDKNAVHSALKTMQTTLPNLQKELLAIDPLWQDTIYKPKAEELLRILIFSSQNELKDVANIITQDSVSPTEFTRAQELFAAHNSRVAGAEEALYNAGIEMHLHHYYRERSGGFCTVCAL